MKKSDRDESLGLGRDVVRYGNERVEIELWKGYDEGASLRRAPFLVNEIRVTRTLPERKVFKDEGVQFYIKPSRTKVFKLKEEIKIGEDYMPITTRKWEKVEDREFSSQLYCKGKDAEYLGMME